ncbi:hypothetical protein [Knoellia subterranea]|uniref:hypothetical protein n=1 Tax=Knoellia subterranea TaxID=184882 RepID=UPI0012EB555D|nr:hypothetical protein [Knoellia subterranea]
MASVPVGVRIKLLGNVMSLHGEDPAPLLRELRELFAIRNVYAHTIWMWIAPDRARWDGVRETGVKIGHVAVTEQELDDIDVRIEAARKAIDAFVESVRPGFSVEMDNDFDKAMTSYGSATEADRQRLATSQQEMAKSIADEIVRLLAQGPDVRDETSEQGA